MSEHTPVADKSTQSEKLPKFPVDIFTGKNKYEAVSRPREQICYLKCQRYSVTVFAADEVPHLIVDADAETGVNFVLLTEPLHGHQYQV